MDDASPGSETDIRDLEGLFRGATGFEGLQKKSEISQVFYVLGKEERITVFHEISKGKRLTDIKEDVDVAGSTVHNYANDLIDAGLVEKNSGYSLTWKGERVLSMLEDLEVVLLLEDLQDMGFPVPPDDKYLEQLMDSEDLGVEKLLEFGISEEEVKSILSGDE